MALANKEIYQTGAIRDFEKPEVCEAIKVANANKWTVCLSPAEWDEREARLKKEYEQNTKAPGPGEEQPEEKKGIIYPTTFPKADFYYKHVLNEGNPALKAAASQFNDALLDEQANEIKNLTMKNGLLEDKIAIMNACKKYEDKIDRSKIKYLGKEIARLNKIIHKKNLKIEELRKESSEHLRGKIKMFYENVDLEDKLKDKDAVLSDVAEELRLSKIREKNLTEVGQKYMNENEELKKKLADKVVDKIDARALKSAESALAYKEKVIAEKDEVIADLGKELKAKHKKYVWYKGAYEAAQQILNTIADYAAKHPDKKFSDQMVGIDIAEEGADHSGATAIWGKDFVKKFKENEDFFHDIFKARRIKPATDMFTDFGPLDCMELVMPNNLSPFIDENSHGEVTNQKDISPNLKVTVRLYGKNFEDLIKKMK